jgi:homoserine kinase
MIRDAFEDVIIEPQRQALIPGFRDVKAAAMQNGALGCSISGAGPTVFCWCETPAAERIRTAMIAAFAAHKLDCDSWISSIEATGARILEP